MNNEIIINRYGLGHAAVVLVRGQIIDCFIDPPKDAVFYPPNTLLKAHIDRKAPNIGGYFVKLPNGVQGFLKSKNKYKEGSLVSLMSQIFFELNKPQTFTDVLESVSKYFVIKISDNGYSFSKKLPESFDRTMASNILFSKIKDFNDLFIICRSSAASINFQEFDNEAGKAIAHFQNIKLALALDRFYYDGLARNIVLDQYKNELHSVNEEDGVFEQLGVWEQLEEIKNGRILLNTGSFLIFEQTKAFLSVDVNSGTDFKSTKEQINLNACSEIFRIIRVCGFGGKILIDFLPCSPASRRKIYKKLLNYFSKDTVKIKLYGWTKGGTFELERKRNKIPLKLLI